VNTIGNNILHNITPRQGITYTFKVIDTNDVNAFALPGGWIYVERGLIEAAKGDNNQVAGVIAHEIGHVQARHAAEQIGRQEIYGVAIGTLTKGNTQQWANVFANLNLLHYSREEEYEADKLAIDYTCPSQYNPKGLIDFFQTLVASEKKGASPSFLRTHPLTENRILRAEQYLGNKRAAGQCK
jgi:predicted Zn-dependent protease